MQKFMFSAIVFLLTASTLTAQQLGDQTLRMLNESPAGSKIIRYIDLFNSDKKINGDLTKSLFSERLIGKYGVEKLADILENARRVDGTLELWEAKRTSMFHYDLTFRSENTGSWLTAFFEFEEKQPYKIDGFGLEANGPAPNAEAPMYGKGKTGVFAPSEISVSPKELATEADQIAKAYENLGWFSGVVMLAQDGKPFFEKAYGYADIENNERNTLQHKFRIGSINKDYTAVLMLQQVERGYLSLDDKLSKFDLGFPKNTAEKITVRHLLNHTSGFGDIFTPEYIDNIRSYKNIDDALPLLRNEPLEYEPGTDQRYSNYGFVVLGAILEKTTGKSFGQLLKENIFSVIGCKDTHYDIAENISGEAKSYRYLVTGEKVDHTPMLEYPKPDGGMYATAADQLRFFQALFYSDKLISDASKMLLVNDFQPTDRKWSEVLANPRAGAAYAGGGPGVNAVVGVEFKENLTIIVLANTDQMIAEEIYQRIMDAMRGRSYPPATLPAANYLYGILKEKGTDYVVDNFEDLMEKGGYPDDGPMVLNGAGYSLMQQGMLDDAIEVFTANVRLFPKEANPYDSLAEACLKKGDREKALTYYKKALEIDPEFPSAKRMVKELEGK